MKHGEKKAAGSGFGFWVLVWGLGIIGQLCWNVENQWFNTFVYAKIAKDPTIISWMVAISSIATTVSTFIFGTASDRSGRRKPFVAIGYILWGIFTIFFGLTQYLAGSTLVLAATAVVAADAIMSFFGSMGSDAAYNAWTNDLMNDRNRGGIGAALATQPVLGTILGTILGGFLIGSDDNYMRLFLTMGSAVILLGVLTLFFMKESPDLKPNRDGTFLHQLLKTFDGKRLLEMKELIWVFLTLMVYFVSFNVYFPHMGNYFIYYLGFDADLFGLIEGAALLVGMLVVIPASKLISGSKYPLGSAMSVVFTCAGVLVFGLTVTPDTVNPTSFMNPNVLIGLLLVGFGYVMFMQVMAVWMKQLFPADNKGQFEGFRIVFFVLLPWLISPLFSNPIIKATGMVTEAGGEVSYLPTNTLFLFSAVLVLLTYIPLVFAARCNKGAVKR